MRKPISEKVLVIIAGATATGKTRLSIELACRYHTEIVSCDSRQFFKELKTGTAPPDARDLARVPHHFIGNLSVFDNYNVYKFEKEALACLDSLFENHPLVVAVGGSGLYIEAVSKGIDELPDPDPLLRKELQQRLHTEGIQALQDQLKNLDPVYFAGMDTANPKRLIRALEVCLTTGLPFSQLRLNQPKTRNFTTIKIGLNLDRTVLFSRIDARVDQMIAAGLVEEARDLFLYRNLNALNTVGYKELFEYFDGSVTLEQAIANIKTHTRRYAKRQMTWFKKDPSIRWFPPDDLAGIQDLLDQKITKGPAVK